MPANKIGEIEHGRKIVGHADSVWGWTSEAGRMRAERRAQLLISRANVVPGRKVLEIGCGTGVFTSKLAETNATIWAIDISLELLDMAKARCQQAEFRVADVEDLPFGDALFDAVVGSSILHHLNLEPALREIRRVLKVGGRMAFAEPNMMNPQIMATMIIPLLRTLSGFSPSEMAFFKWEISGLLRKLSFSNVVVEPYDFLHPAVPLSIIPLVGRMGLILEKMPLLKEIAGSLFIMADKM